MKLAPRQIIMATLICLVGGLCIFILTADWQAERKHHRPLVTDQEYYDQVWQEEITTEQEKVIAGIVPHHLTAKALIVELMRKISATDAVTIVLLGPNHFFRGEGSIITSNYDWETPYGELETNSDFIAKMSGTGLVSLEPPAMNEEFSIGNEVAFIKNIFPEAQLVPLILKDSLPAHQSYTLAEKLNQMLPENSLLLVSVDFSHYHPKEIAEIHDATSKEIIARFAYPDIDLMEVDSRASIRTLLRYCELREATNWHLVANTNSAEILNEDFNSTTSYITGYFTK